MTFLELPIEIQQQLNEQRINLHKKVINTSYEIHIYNTNGTRYFSARRVQSAWYNNKGGYMPFGGGSKWIVKYGCVQFRKYRNPLGIIEFELCDGKVFTKAANGTIISNYIDKKSDVIDLIKKIGIFDLNL